MKTFRYLEDLATLRYDSDACVGCGTCAVVCPHGVMEMAGKRAELRDPGGCMECGACALNCPTEALRVTPGVGCAAYIIATWLKGRDGAARGTVKCC